MPKAGAKECRKNVSDVCPLSPPEAWGTSGLPRETYLAINPFIGILRAVL